MKQIITTGVAFALLLSCASNSKMEKVPGKNNLIPFVEFYTITEGKALSGTATPGRRIDGPGYSYDSVSQKLEIYRNNLTDTLNIKLYLGVGKVLKGTAGQGVSSMVIGLNNLPFTQNDLTITNATKTKVGCSYKGKRFVLKPGQEYLFTETRIDTLPNTTVIQTTTTLKAAFKGFVKNK